MTKCCNCGSELKQLKGKYKFAVHLGETNKEIELTNEIERVRREEFPYYALIRLLKAELKGYQEATKEFKELAHKEYSDLVDENIKLKKVIKELLDDEIKHLDILINNLSLINKSATLDMVKHHLECEINVWKNKKEEKLQEIKK